MDKQGRYWTREQEMILVMTILDYVKKGEKIKDAIEAIALKIGKTPKSVSFHWSTKLRPKYLNELNKSYSLYKTSKEDLSKDEQVSLVLENDVKGKNQDEPKKLFVVKQRDNAGGSALNSKSQPNNSFSIPNENKTVSKTKTKNTKLQKLLEVSKEIQNEELSVLDSGAKGKDFVVIENDLAYIVVANEEKVVSCNCSKQIDFVCKHMVKVALTKNLELF